MSMERLTLNRRPKTGDKIECLPAGDGLPVWSTIPLDAKLPMMKNPKGSVTLCTTKLGQPKHKCKQEFDFDLRDPYGNYSCNEYKPLHDPHLKAHFRSQVMRRHLIRKGFVSEDGKVLCSLKEFNQYRQYLRHVFFLEIAKERREELEKIHKQASEQKQHDIERSLSRGTIVRRRLQQQREEEKHKLNADIAMKADRLKRRLQEVRDELLIRERKRQEEAKRRQENVQKNQQEVEDRNMMLLKKWRQRDRMRTKLMQDRDMHRRLHAEMLCMAKWDERKRSQRVRLSQVDAVIKQEDQERQDNIAKREQFVCRQRNRLEQKLERLKQHMKEEKIKRDELYSKRFREKLASGDYKLWTKRKGATNKRRTRNKTFYSTWKLEDILLNLTLTDSNKQRGKSSFMAIINEAMDGIEEPPDMEDLEQLRAQAKEIVQDVFSRVTNEIYPAYLKSLEAEEEVPIQSRSVRFSSENDQIDIDVTQMLPPDDIHTHDDDVSLRPVSEHILTPCASQLEIQKLEAEAILGSPELRDKTSSVTFVETLLLRLLDDLNSGKLSKEDIMKLASYSMDIIQSTENGTLTDDTIIETMEESDSPDADESSSSIIAKKMVDFTLTKILSDIQSGNVHPDDLASLTVTLLDDAASSESSASISISDQDLEAYIEETLRAATSTALDPREDSPVCEALLDDFMVNTLKKLITDLETESLSKSQVETLAISVRDETKEILPSDSEDDLSDSKALQQVLHDILGQLQGGNIGTQNLYQIVFAIVYSYNMIKAPPTPSFENKITHLMKDILFTAEQKAVSGDIDNVNVNIVHEASRRLSQGNLDVNQIEQISSSIISTVSKPEVMCRTTTSDIARAIVEDALARAKEKLESEYQDDKFSRAVQNVAEAVISTTAGVGIVESGEEQSLVETLLQVLTSLKSFVQQNNVIEQSDMQDIDHLITQITDNNIAFDQLEQMSISIARVMKSPIKSESSLSACLVVRDVLKNVNQDLQQGAIEDAILKDIIDSVMMSLRTAQSVDAKSPALLNALASFLKTVLLYVTDKVQTGEFSDSDIRDMSKAMKQNIGEHDSLLGLKDTVFEEVEIDEQSSPKNYPETSPQISEQEIEQTEECQESKDVEAKPSELDHENVLDYFQKLLNEVEDGNIPSESISTLGKRLIECGKSLLKDLSIESSAIFTPGSDVLADNVVEEVIRTLQLEIASGSLTQDSVKEITKTILSTTSSRSDLASELVRNTIRGIHRDVERGYEPSKLPSIPTLDHSPSASTVASHIVMHTIEALQQDISQHMLSDSIITSIASSIVSIINEDHEMLQSLPQDFSKVKKTIAAIITCLKNDSIDRLDAEKIFCVILEKYKEFVSKKGGTQEESLPSVVSKKDISQEDMLQSEVSKKDVTKSESLQSEVSKKCVAQSASMSNEVSKTSVAPSESLTSEDMALINDLVAETLHNIERSVQQGKLPQKEFSLPSLIQSDGTSLAANELVDQCIDAIKRDLATEVTFSHNRFRDISDFILDVVVKLRSELVSGTISNLSMAHFFQAISDDHSDLRTLEQNADVNLGRIIEDIETNRIHSIYIQKILETYLTTERVKDGVFTDPVKAVESILINVSSDILTKFVKATLQNILIEIREGNNTVVEKPQSVIAIQSASSMIAESVIEEVIARIKGDMTKSIHKIHGNVSKQELERAASKLLSESPEKNYLKTLEAADAERKPSKSNHTLSSVRSKDVENIVLETLHNIVSNLRFEQSMHSRKHETGSEHESSNISSEVQDFVLHTLQNIVTDLQDRRSQMDLGLPRTRSKYGSSIELVSGESKEAMTYVNEVLQGVLMEMKQEFARQSAEQAVSGEIKAEVDVNDEYTKFGSVIVECLLDATKEENPNSEAIVLEPTQKEEVHQILVETVLGTLKNVRAGRLSLEDLETIQNSVFNYFGEPICTDHDDLQEQVAASLERVLFRLNRQDLDDILVGNLATQVATLGMDNSVSPGAGSPDHAASDISISSSVISDLVQDVLSRISQQIEIERSPPAGNHVQPNGDDIGVDVNFNRKDSASSSRTDTTIKSIKPVNIIPGISVSHKDQKKKEKEKRSVKSPKPKTDKTNSKKPVIKTTKSCGNATQTSIINAYRPQHIPVRPTKSPTPNKDRRDTRGKQSSVHGTRAEQSPVRGMHGKHSPVKDTRGEQSPVQGMRGKQSPVQKQHGNETNFIRIPQMNNVDQPKSRKSVPSKPSKSVQNQKPVVRRSPLPGSCTVVTESDRTQKQQKPKSSKRKKKCETQPKSQLSVAPIEDPSVLKSVCGAHKTKICVREGNQ